MYTDLERESEGPNKTQRERDLEEEEEQEVGRVGWCSRAREREREREREFIACNSVLLCFSVYTTLPFCQLMMMAVCFARGLSRGLAVTSFLKWGNCTFSPYILTFFHFSPYILFFPLLVPKTNLRFPFSSFPSVNQRK